MRSARVFGSTGRAAATAAAWLCVSAAAAQEVPPTDARADPPATAPDTPPAGAAPGIAAAGTADIIVTAERRAVNIQKAPISITAFSGAELANRNITTPNALQSVLPGVRLVEINVNPSLLIRGVGQAVANVYNDPSASYNVDGVPVVRPLSINGLFFDLERVEVLKGPQGTLYGRNATVGAINVLSTRPTHEFGAKVQGRYESYDGKEIDGAINLPVGETLAVRVGGILNHHDGYISNGTDDKRSFGGRLKALWEPASALTVLLTASYYKDTGKGPGDVPLKSAKGSFLDPDHPWRLLTGPALNPADRATRTPDDARQNLHSQFYGADISYDAGPVTLTIVPAHIKTKYDALSYNGGFKQVTDTSDRQNSVEARLASSGAGPFKWIVGGIYIDDLQKGEVINTSQPTIDQRNVFNSVVLKSYAFFAQGTYSLTDALRLTGGIRYTHDHKTLDGFVQNIVIATRAVASAYTSIGDTSFENTSYRAGIDYDLGPDSLLFANFATGYKAGGFQPGLAPNVFAPEKNTAYTVGVKNRFLDRRLTFNVEAWYWDYRNYQFVQFGFINPRPNFSLTTINAPKLEDYGVEVQSAFQFTPRDRLSLDVAYTQAKFKVFSAPAFPVLGVPATDYSGDHLTRAPVWSGVVSYLHSFELGGGHLDFGIKEQFESRTRIVPQHILGAKVGGVHVTDLDLTYFTADGKYQVGAYVTNLENEPVIYFSGNTPAGLWGHPRPPRIIGVRAGATF